DASACGGRSSSKVRITAPLGKAGPRGTARPLGRGPVCGNTPFRPESPRVSASAPILPPTLATAASNGDCFRKLRGLSSMLAVSLGPDFDVSTLCPRLPATFGTPGTGVTPRPASDTIRVIYIASKESMRLKPILYNPDK